MVHILDDAIDEDTLLGHESLILLAYRHGHAAGLFLRRRLGGGLGEAKACRHVPA